MASQVATPQSEDFSKWHNEIAYKADLAAVDTISKKLAAHNIRIYLDKRENLPPGFKVNAWEMRGVLVRMGVGLKDVGMALQYR